MVYIVEKNHQLIASSIQEKPYLIAEDKETSLRRHAYESENLLIKNSSAFLQQHTQLEGELTTLWNSNFLLSEENYLLQVTPFSLDENLRITSYNVCYTKLLRPSSRAA